MNSFNRKLKRGLDLGLNLKFTPLILYLTIPALLFLSLLYYGVIMEGGQQFSLLAKGFTHGHLFIDGDIGGVGQDPVIYNGHTYWDEGPFPAIILTPFQLVFNIWHKLFYQGYIKWLFVLGVSYLVYKIARKLKYDRGDSFMLVAAMTLGSVFIGVNGVSSSWLFAQIINTFLLFWIIYEFLTKKRLLLIGSLVAMVLMTRISAAPIVLLPLLDILMRKRGNDRIKDFTRVLAPILIAVLLLLSYNYLRFGNPLQNGNKYQVISHQSALSRDLGLFSPVHIPTNLYTLILGGPMVVVRNSDSWTLKAPFIKNNYFGMSIFITSPYFLYFFFTKLKKYPLEAKLLLICAFFSCLMVLCYYGIGAMQMGYRYSLDFIPELFVAFMMIYKKNNKKLSNAMKSLFLITILSDFYFFVSSMGQ